MFFNKTSKNVYENSGKQHLQRTLAKLGVYERLKTSCLYDLYWNLAGRRYVMQQKSGGRDSTEFD